MCCATTSRGGPHKPTAGIDYKMVTAHDVHRHADEPLNYVRYLK